MDNDQLQKLVEQISWDCFQKPFLHRAIFNPRLRTTGGRYLLQSGTIEVNKKYYEAYGESELIGIIRHELCHYHLHQEKRGYRHRDKDFKDLAKMVHAPRYCKPLPSEKKKVKPKYHYYQCESCLTVYRRGKRVDLRKYACGKCGGKLKKIERISPGE